MPATVQDVRFHIGDTEEPYIFSDVQIQQALDEAKAILEAEGISVDSVLGARAHKLQASIFLISAFLGRIRSRVVKSIREGDIHIDYVDLQKQLEAWKEELEELKVKLIEVPFEAVYDSF